MNDRPVAKRQELLKNAIVESDLRGIVLSPGPSFKYFTDLDFHTSERPVVAWITPDHPIAFVLPEFEASKLNVVDYEHIPATYSEEISTWSAAFSNVVEALALFEGNLGGEPRTLRLLEIDFIRSAAPGLNIASAEEKISDLRLKKDDIEIQSMRTAAEIAQTAVQRALRSVSLGMTELELASLLTAEILLSGSDPQLPFSPIVGFGPNSALPHYFPGERRLEAGDIILIDWGASSDGYVSDITRVFLAGSDPSRYQEIVNKVAEANMAAQHSARPGVTAGSLDDAARGVITRSGRGELFTHRTGHGLGLEAHEPPYIRAGNPRPLAPGMIFTIEPGIYLTGQFGVRIEDDVLITEDGSASLTNLTREILPLSAFQ